MNDLPVLQFKVLGRDVAFEVQTETIWLLRTRQKERKHSKIEWACLVCGSKIRRWQKVYAPMNPRHGIAFDDRVCIECVEGERVRPEAT